MEDDLATDYNVRILIVFSPVMIRMGIRNRATLGLGRFGNGSDDRVFALTNREFCMVFTPLGV